MFLRCCPICSKNVYNFEYSTRTPIIGRKQIATFWQHSKDSVTPTRVTASNGKPIIEHIEETFVQTQIAVNKTFGLQTTGISAFVPFHFPQNYIVDFLASGTEIFQPSATSPTPPLPCQPVVCQPGSGRSGLIPSLPQAHLEIGQYKNSLCLEAPQ